jgi:hypothetical protein
VGSVLVGEQAAVDALDQVASTVSVSSRSSSRVSMGAGKENAAQHGGSLEQNRSPSRRVSALPSKPLPAFTSGRASLTSSFD